MPDASAALDAELVALAHEGLLEITPAATIGEPLTQTSAEDGVVTIEFATAMGGYPDWRWTVSLAKIGDDPATVLEAELLPGEGALLAPDWLPWSERLEEYRAAQAAAASDDESDEDESDEDDADDDGDDDSDEDDADEDDDDADDDESDDDDDSDEDGEDFGDDVYDGLDPESAVAADDDSADDDSADDDSADEGSADEGSDEHAGDERSGDETADDEPGAGER
jgi:hypothetical protein